MRTPLALAVALFFLITIPLLGAKNSRGAENNQGKTLYNQNCAICHGKNAAGDGPAAASLSPGPANLTKAAFWHHKNVDQLIARTVLHGHGAMPPFPLKPAQLKALTEYMSHTFKPPK